MRIGIVPAPNRSGGGVYQYSITMLRALAEWKEKACEDEFIVFASQAHDPTFRSLNGGSWTFQPLFPVAAALFTKRNIGGDAGSRW